jgi:hypothetical protein
MSDTFQRLLTMSDVRPLSMSEQAALGVAKAPHRSQLSLLIRHFLERFFNHETASSDGDAKTRLVQIAFATGVPGLMVAVYLWPVYHPFRGWPPGQPSDGGPPPFWLQVNHHFFFVLYSFVAMGIVTVFEWDMFFPDLLDMWVLKSLPIREGRIFAARAIAIAILISGFLLDANFMAILVLPSATDPPNLGRFLLAHTLSVAASGFFAAALVLAFQGVLLSVFGERLFRRVSLLIQSLTITALLMLLFLFPVFSGAVPVLVSSSSRYAQCCPPFWFLGMYESILAGNTALPGFLRLAHVGMTALLITGALAVAAYPVAYLRRVSQLVEGPPSRSKRGWMGAQFDCILHAAIVRLPLRRAIFHFISQTVIRVPRYRVYLMLYAGVGLSVLAAMVLRLSVAHGTVRLAFSPDGIRSSLAITGFWTIAGFRVAFMSAGNRKGNWVFRIVHGRPPQFESAIAQLDAAMNWVLLWTGALIIGVGLALRSISPPEMLTRTATAVHLLVGLSICMLIIDALFLSVTTIAFTGEPVREQPNLAFIVLKYFTFFPVVVAIPLIVEPWIAAKPAHILVAIAAVATGHVILRTRHRAAVRQHCNMPALEDDEEDFPMKLGLRY